MKQPQAKIANGTFTLIWPDGQRHKTFKIKTQAADSRFMPGKRVISLMTGRDNNSDYTSFGLVDNLGIKIWQTISTGTSKVAFVYNDGKLPIWTKVLWDLALNGENSRFYATGMRLEAAERCIVCNRKLTNPLSIATKIGPECSARLSGKRHYGGRFLPEV